MNASNQVPFTSDELNGINRELAGLLHKPAATLTLGAEGALADPLVLCGVLGGKDVGKSTLVNALAKTVVSRDDQEVGRGTSRPRAYVHREMAALAVERLSSNGFGTQVDVTLHDADAIRNLVLIDLPDFDSEFTDHLDIVRNTSAHLDRILWVVTPRKIGDRDWVALFRLVIVDPGNVLLVLNKVDELLANVESFGGPEARDNGSAGAKFWSGRHAWAAGVAKEVGCSYEDSQRFLVASGFPSREQFVTRVAQLWDDPGWSKFSREQSVVAAIGALATADLDRLRATVLSPVSTDRAVEIKANNVACQFRSAVDRLAEHYELDRLANLLDAACEAEYYTELIEHSFGADGLDRCTYDVRSKLPGPVELADNLLRRQVEDWPVLRLVYWAAGWLSRGLGRRAVAIGTQPVAGPASAPIVTPEWLNDRISLLRARFLAEQAALLDELQLAEQISTANGLTREVEVQLDRLPLEIERELLDTLSAQQRRPRFFAKAAVLFVLLWFPFIQPIAKEALRVYNETTTITLALAGYHVISLLSAPHILASMGVVALIFIALLTAMFVRRLRRARTALTDPAGPGSIESIDGRVALAMSSTVGRLLAGPLSARLAPIQRIRDRLHAFRDP